MFANYLKLAIRNLQKQRTFAAINVFGLSVGIACFILLLLYAANEFGFDRFHRNARDIYRLYTVWTDPYTGKIQPQVYTDIYSPTNKSVGPAIKQYFPDVVDYTRFQLPWGESLLRAGGKNIRTEVSFADPSLFTLFDFPLLAGTKSGVLRSPQDLVITASRATQLFGSPEKALGQSIDILLGPRSFPFKVSGVAQDPPANSSIRFDIIGSFQFTLAHSPDDFVIGNNWHTTVQQTFVQLKQGSHLPGDQQQIQRFKTAFTEPNTPCTLHLQPLLAIHTDINFHAYGITDYQRIDPQTFWIMLGIATGILLIACINFTTLAIARSASRGKEVGIRKVIGAQRSQIILQFLAEAILLSAIAAVVGFLLAKALLPWFNQLAGRQLHLNPTQSPLLLLALIGVVLFAGILAGSYPALVLARFRPVEVLKNKLRLGGSNIFTRWLVSFQFALAITLIGSTIVILRQTKFMLNKNPGFEKENLIVVDATQTDPDKTFPVFQQSLLNHPEIIAVTSAAASMGAGKELFGYSDKGIKADINIIDTNYIRVMGMKLLVGTNLQPAPLTDSLRPVVINETFMHAMGWNEHNVVGKQIIPFQGRIAVVRGVVKNFNYQPVGKPVFNQIFISTGDHGYAYFYVRVRPGDPANPLKLLQSAWHTVAPAIPMKYSFFDEDINAFYQSEQIWISIISGASAMSIVLACLGLLGLASLAAVNRRKEVGIRKVLGASIQQLILLLSKEFLRLVALAFLIATPITGLMMNKWLQGYAVRTDLPFSVLLLPGVVAILTAVLAVAFQAFRAAAANPVDSLRSE